ncbi:hypothetical protein PAXRUDRAFT_828990 [Paxillus rubicundulus Ve08.2h10]|uniref:Unplaced genomic scaffold scaffold_363, whole genome shotgun sequence n=1 Tax=Paxillus rubicundulus Ve08.2h10 TaxID=930991 RepID=A0A0D0E6Q3_9AGAM|nr:hypothetical protein PAXRUDRAFT_828990 [Paxillus rubicundulus Ve08.2h10]
MSRKNTMITDAHNSSSAFSSSVYGGRCQESQCVPRSVPEWAKDIDIALGQSAPFNLRAVEVHHPLDVPRGNQKYAKST